MCAADYRTLAGIDPASGDERWSLPCEGDAPPVRRTCILRPITVLDGQLLVQRVVLAGERISSAVLAVDLTTGEVIAQQAGWSPAPESMPGRWLVGQEDPARPDAEPGRFWLVRWAGDAPRFQVRGPIEAQWCQPPSGEHLVCVPADGHPQVWQIR